MGFNCYMLICVDVKRLFVIVVICSRCYVSSIGGGDVLDAYGCDAYKTFCDVSIIQLVVRIMNCEGDVFNAYGCDAYKTFCDVGIIQLVVRIMNL